MPERLPITARDVHRQTGSDLAARGLGFLSLMLGAMEVAGARPIAAMLGIRGQENFVRLCGAREILQGAAILTARDPTLWVWVRVAGDALDIGTLAAEHYMGNRSKRRNLALAFGAVLGITALDVMNARKLSREKREPWSPPIDFSARSGLPGRDNGLRRGRPRAPTPGRGLRAGARFRSRAREDALQPAEAM
jgi:hypothetical protein